MSSSGVEPANEVVTRSLNRHFYSQTLCKAQRSVKSKEFPFKVHPKSRRTYNNSLDGSSQLFHSSALLIDTRGRDSCSKVLLGDNISLLLLLDTDKKGRRKESGAQKDRKTVVSVTQSKYSVTSKAGKGKSFSRKKHDQNDVTRQRHNPATPLAEKQPAKSLKTRGVSSGVMKGSMESCALSTQCKSKKNIAKTTPCERIASNCGVERRLTRSNLLKSEIKLRNNLSACWRLPKTSAGDNDKSVGGIVIRGRSEVPSVFGFPEEMAREGPLKAGKSEDLSRLESSMKVTKGCILSFISSFQSLFPPSVTSRTVIGTYPTQSDAQVSTSVTDLGNTGHDGSRLTDTSSLMRSALTQTTSGTLPTSVLRLESGGRSMAKLTAVENLLLDLQITLKTHHALRVSSGDLCYDLVGKTVTRLVNLIELKLQMHQLECTNQSEESATAEELIKLAREKLVYARLLSQSVTGDSSLEASHWNTLKDVWGYCREAHRRLTDLPPGPHAQNLTERMMQSIRVSLKILRRIVKKHCVPEEPLLLQYYRDLRAVDEILSRGVTFLHPLDSQTSHDSHNPLLRELSSVPGASDETFSRVCQSCEESQPVSRQSVGGDNTMKDWCDASGIDQIETLTIGGCPDGVNFSGNPGCSVSFEEGTGCLSSSDQHGSDEQWLTTDSGAIHHATGTGPVVAQRNLLINLTSSGSSSLSGPQLSSEGSRVPRVNFADQTPQRSCQDMGRQNRVQNSRSNIQEDSRCPVFHALRTYHGPLDHFHYPHCNADNPGECIRPLYSFCNSYPVDSAGYFMPPVHPGVSPMPFLHHPFHPYVMSPNIMLNSNHPLQRGDIVAS